jgi:cytochrome b6-f complex iron-sulfur subunit
VDLTNSDNVALNTQGGSVYSNNVIIVRTGSALSSASFVALSQVCTHNGCTVSYDSSTQKILCPCHHGVFDTSGNVVSGPPPSPLTNYKISLNGNILKISS